MNQSDQDHSAREIIQERIYKGLIGPGSDTWGLPEEEEIISDYPLQRYFSGIVFPDKTQCKTDLEADIAEGESEAILKSEDEIDEPVTKELSEVVLENPESESTTVFSYEETKISQNNFFPTNIGISVALSKQIQNIQVDFSLGLYYQPKQSEIKIRISEAGYESFFDEHIPYKIPFSDILKYEDGFMFFSRELRGEQRRPNRELGEYGLFDKFISSSNLKRQSEEGGYFSAYYYVSYLEKLISRVWKRKTYKISLTIPVKSTTESILLDLGKTQHKGVKVGFNVKVIETPHANYAKIQLVNLSNSHPANRFSNKSEILNVKCLFQTNIKIFSEGIIEFKDNSVATYFLDEDIHDFESEEIEFIYRSIKSYGIGHNCSVKWSSDHKSVESTFAPEQNIRDVINEFPDTLHDQALIIKNLTVWGLPKAEVLSALHDFVNDYKLWIDKQSAAIASMNVRDAEISNRLVNRQKENYQRLITNVTILKEEKAFRAFQIANTAMLVQLIASHDPDFSKTGKELSETDLKTNLKSLEYFKNHDSKNKLGFIPKYRPFQLAFFLLSIDGIIDPASNSRKNIVDLIWFPTGGGKTEAYLAVTAFTIAYRRLLNEKGFEGTTVIMRYTLRLLTAQQFERASRLIAALEFLRLNPEFASELKNSPITIGLWVGQASTPNTIQEAKKLLSDDYGMEAEAQKGEHGDPNKYNEFQISSCPWCGTKLISREKDKNGKNFWKYGFKEKRGDFIINCLNPGCPFHERLPIQVIDEILYKKPPTLLFGTVDKFAMLAWQEDAHNFFSTNNENLPPDLIIQDELHLLNGPLGSITGFYESVIELLCTKDKKSPKIIASTATTRNTDLQIAKLYGNRSVNIFPPSGINFNDSYFAKESNESKRRYIGFLPTGKTSIDTQLQILAHLLVARIEIFRNKEIKERTDLYWTIVSYYNSLKDVGRIYNKVGDEISNFTSTLQNRLSDLFQPFDDFKFNFYGIPGRTEELTSRVESAKIKSVLKEIEKQFKESNIQLSEKGNRYLTDVVDLVLATNMISVGIDISRLNLMLINGMPKNIAEYIQASSRIGRKTRGLVITLLDPNRAREKSYFEHFINFHQAFYKSVEPLSITPFTENTLDKMLTTVLVSYVRNKVPAMAKNESAKFFKKEQTDVLVDFLNERFADDPLILNYFNGKLNELISDWQRRARLPGELTYKKLLVRPSDQNEEVVDWSAMQSMREIDTDTFVQIKSDH